MKKELLIFSIFLLCIPFSLALTVSNVECSDGFSFEMNYVEEREFQKNNWAVVATNEAKERFIVDGLWTDLHKASYGFKDAYLFQSRSYVPAGRYAVNLTRSFYDKTHVLEDGTNPLKDRDSLLFNISCPARDFYCGKIQLSVKECYTVTPDAYVIFSGVNNPVSLNDFKFELDGTTYKWDDTLPQGTTYTVTADGLYVFTMPVKDSIIEWATYGLKMCDMKRYNNSAQRVQCSKSRQCSQNTQCADYEFCNTRKNVCEVKQCQVCERPENHGCIGTCPKQTCGVSSCINNSCVVDKTGCDVKQEKQQITGNVVLEEKKEKNWFGRFIDWFRTILS